MQEKKKIREEKEGVSSLTMIEADPILLCVTPTAHKCNIAHVFAEATRNTRIKAWGSENCP
jgi:hypothetical protein